MNSFELLLNSIFNNQYEEFKNILNHGKIRFNSINETELMIKLIRHTINEQNIETKIEKDQQRIEME